MKWFKHYANMGDDPRYSLLNEQHGARGIGVYWLIVEHLHKSEKRTCYRTDLVRAFSSSRIHRPFLCHVLDGYGLFITDRKGFVRTAPFLVHESEAEPRSEEADSPHTPPSNVRPDAPETTLTDGNKLHPREGELPTHGENPRSRKGELHAYEEALPSNGQRPNDSGSVQRPSEAPDTHLSERQGTRSDSRQEARIEASGSGRSERQGTLTETFNSVRSDRQKTLTKASDSICSERQDPLAETSGATRSESSGRHCLDLREPDLGATNIPRSEPPNFHRPARQDLPCGNPERTPDRNPEKQGSEAPSANVNDGKCVRSLCEERAKSVRNSHRFNTPNAHARIDTDRDKEIDREEEEEKEEENLYNHNAREVFDELFRNEPWHDLVIPLFDERSIWRESVLMQSPYRDRLNRYWPIAVFEFGKHIAALDTGASITSVREARHYFANFVREHLPCGRELRQRLDSIDGLRNAPAASSHPKHSRRV